MFSVVFRDFFHYPFGKTPVNGRVVVIMPSCAMIENGTVFSRVEYLFVNFTLNGGALCARSALTLYRVFFSAVNLKRYGGKSDRHYF